MLAVFAAAALIFVSAVPASATTVEDGELTAEITVSAESVKINKTVDVTVAIKNDTQYEISDLLYKFTFNADLFGIVSYPATPSKTMLVQDPSNAGSISISYAAANRTDWEPIAVGATATVTFTMQAKSTATAGTSAAFSVSDMKAYMRKDVTQSSLTDSNLDHTFTFKPAAQGNVTISSLSGDATLTNIVPVVNNAEIEMTPPFSPDVTSYTVVVSYSIPDFKFNWTKTDAAASVTYVPPANNTLAVGENTFQFVVTAEDKTTTKTYTAVVKRLAFGETTAATTTTETTSTTSTTTTTATTTSFTTTAATALLPENEPDRTNEDGNFGTTVGLSLGTLLGLIGAAIALFLLAFFAGYVTHKNATKPAEPTMKDILAAQMQLESQQLAPAPVPAEPVETAAPVESAEDHNGILDSGYYSEMPQGGYGMMPPMMGMQMPPVPGAPMYGQYGQFYEAAPQMPAPTGQQPSEFTALPEDASARPHEDEYDEYGYNIYGESNIEQ